MPKKKLAFRIQNLKGRKTSDAAEPATKKVVKPAPVADNVGNPAPVSTEAQAKEKDPGTSTIELFLL